MIERFVLGKDYDCDGNWEYCYEDNETGRRFNFEDDFCHTDFLKTVNTVIDNLRKENNELKEELRIYRQVANCHNCRYQDYDWFDDGDEFEVCRKGNDVSEGICKDWEEL